VDDFPRPTRRFEKVLLDITTVGSPERYGRIFLSKYPDPLGFGKSPSRFSDPRRLARDKRFGVLYLGHTLKVCFLEAVLRDQRNGFVGDYPIEEDELHNRMFSEIEFTTPLQLVNLRGDGHVRMGIPSDAVHASDQRAGRSWSLALYNHPDRPDGILYSSRLNEQTNIAIYDRAVHKLRVSRSQKLLHAPGIADMLDDLLIAVL